MNSTQEITNKISEWFLKYHAGEPADKMVKLYEDLIEEESGETALALAWGDVVEIYDGLGDLYRVLMGAIYFLFEDNGLDDEVCDVKINHYMSQSMIVKKFMGKHFDKVMKAIIKSNFSKEVSETKRGDGKIIKGPNFKKPDLSFLYS